MEPNSTTSAGELSPDFEIISHPSDSDESLRNALGTLARNFDDWTEQGLQISVLFKSFQGAILNKEKVDNAKLQNLEQDKLKEEIRRRAAEKKLEELQKHLTDSTYRIKEYEQINEDLLQQVTQRDSKISQENKRFSELFNRWKESEQLAPFMETWENGEGLDKVGSELQMLENNMDVLVKFGETMETVMKNEKVDNEKKITNLIDDMKKQALAMFSPSAQYLQASTRPTTRHEQGTTNTPVSKGQQESHPKISTRSATSSKRKMTVSSYNCSTNDATATQKRGRQSEPSDSVLKHSIPYNISSKENPEPRAKVGDTESDDDCFLPFVVKKKVKREKPRGVKN